jgi:NAD(P)-dependent dehydrogenase (short-subunit alcohol dehydrogenase family)
MSSKDIGPLEGNFFPKYFIKNQFRTPTVYPPKDLDLTSQVAIVTGSNTGLGYEASRQLLSYKLSHLVMAVRTVQKGETAADQLRKDFPQATIEVWMLDMNSYESIQSFADRVKSDLPRLDMAILNAGLGKQTFGTVPATGHEESVQVNYLSTSLLAILLLPILKTRSPSGKPGRLTLINSATAYMTKFQNRDAKQLLASFDDPKQWDGNDRYGSSKLLGQMFTYKLLEYVSADDVIINLADPGLVKGTGLGGKGGILISVARSIFSLAGRTVEAGATAYVDAVAVKGKESHGCFLMSWEIAPSVQALI